jgi:hypothetical protein
MPLTPGITARGPSCFATISDVSLAQQLRQLGDVGRDLPRVAQTNNLMAQILAPKLACVRRPDYSAHVRMPPIIRPALGG